MQRGIGGSCGPGDAIGGAIVNIAATEDNDDEREDKDDVVGNDDGNENPAASSRRKTRHSGYRSNASRCILLLRGLSTRSFDSVARTIKRRGWGGEGERRE